MRSRHGHDILICGQYAEDFRAFQHTEAAAAEPGRFGVVVGDGGRIDDERVVRIAERGGDAGRVVLVMDVGPFGGESAREGGFCPVVSAHPDPFEQVIAGDGAHADAADSQEIDILACVSVMVCVRV